MRTRTWAVFIVINVIVSAAVMLTILLIWERFRTPDSPASPPAATLPVTEEQSAPVPTAQPVVSPTPRPTQTYTVQDGDTLSGIAQFYDVAIEDLMAANGLTDPNLLQVGQVLVIPDDQFPIPTADSLPADEATAAPTEAPSPEEPLPTPLPTLTPAGPSLIEIGQVLGSGDLASEVVVMRNRGGTTDLEGWTLSDAEGNIFTLPAITLFTDTQLRVHSTAGRSTPSDLYWGRETPAWNGGELLTLRDAAGNVIDTYIVP